MMNRQEFLSKHPNLKTDMFAYSDDDEKLGKVMSLNEDSIDIQKGDFFPKDFAIRYDDIEDIQDGRLVVNKSVDELSPWVDEDYEGWSQIGELNKGTEFDILLHEEELEAHRIQRQSGQVRLKKVVHTEEKTFTIPVTREEVVIERLSESEAGEAGEEKGVFKEEEITIPIMTEEVEIVKHQRVMGKVHAKKEAHIEQQQVSGRARVEDVEVLRESASQQEAAPQKSEESSEESRGEESSGEDTGEEG